MESDQRTEHAALPPTGGVKVGVNMWIHQFECATATRANSAAAKACLARRWRPRMTIATLF